MSWRRLMRHAGPRRELLLDAAALLPALLALLGLWAALPGGPS